MIVTAPLYFWFLLALPVLWWLVRALPPRPREQSFPPTLLLNRLRAKRHDATHMPLWLLLLRLAAISALIVAFTRPVLLPSGHSQTPAHRVIILDNGWASSLHWHDRLQTARALAEPVLRQGGKVMLLSTARNANGQWPAPLHPRTIDAFDNALHDLQPQGWPVERATLAHQLNLPELRQNLEGAHIVLLSDSLADGHEAALRQALAPAHHIDDIRWADCSITRLHSLSTTRPYRLAAETLPHCPSHVLSLQGLSLGIDGHFRTIAHWTIQSNQPFTATLPPALATRLDALRLEGVAAPAGMLLLHGARQQQAIGVLHLAGDTIPLTGSAFYLMQALNGFSTPGTGDSTNLLRHPLSLLVAPDGSLASDEERRKIRHWVSKGGILLRFAGPLMAQEDASTPEQAETLLLPVPLVHGLRQLGGPMSWGKPQPLAPFFPSSPFSGLDVPSEVSISRQVLAQPSEDLQHHVWATLTDGTPLVTARQEGKGMIVLFHTTPTANWSNLPLSGLFPQMLERLATMSSSIGEEKTSPPSRDLPPWKILDPSGRLTPPTATTLPLPATGKTPVSAFHPAGFYGSGGNLHPLNLDTDSAPLAEEPLLGQIRTPDLIQTEHPLAPWLALSGLALLLLDALLSLKRQGVFSSFFSSAIGLCLLSFAPATAFGANNASKAVPPAALDTRLAYIHTGDTETDNAVEEGLEGVSHFINQRSTAHLGQPIAVVPGQDNLGFYPLLYWPILPRTRLDDAGSIALNDYMHHGGLLVIDEMGAGSLLDGNTGQATHAALKRVTRTLDIPPLMQLNDQHVLAHSFYLLHDFPGRIAGQPVYVARADNNDGDTISPVILGNSDWAHAWAMDGQGNSPFATIPDSTHQRTLAWRFGMNMVMYALTGNYKNDQRLYPEMLRRLGQAGDENSTGNTDDTMPDDMPTEDTP